jgi:Cof subfamily protein (haloacid dehalogenase superfamily)
MDKKYIFFDLDGTLIDHSLNKVRPKTLEALELLKENGHEVFIATGRPPSLFYGIDKELGIDSYIASNGSVVKFHDSFILRKAIDSDVVRRLVEYAYKNEIDVGFESIDDYVVNSRFTELVDRFSDKFHLHYPEEKKDYHLENEIYQMVLFYNQADFKKFEEMFPELWFNFSNEYGLDINAKGGLKELGIMSVIEHLNIKREDIIAVGDGRNDIGMIEFAEIGIAMGNAHESVKKAADIVCDDISNDGLYKVFKELKLI